MPVAAFCMFFTSQEINIKWSPNAAKLFVDFSRPEDTCWAKKVPEGSSKGSTTHQGVPRGPGAPRWVVATSAAFRTASLLYKYLNIPETLGESTKINSSCRKFQNHQIQSRHHMEGFIMLIGASLMIHEYFIVDLWVCS